jgi:trehalose-phosphatase
MTFCPDEERKVRILYSYPPELRDAVPDWSPTIEDLLGRFLNADRPGLLTDMDGTISPIVDDPAAAMVTPASKQALAILRDALPVVGVISGRGAGDVHARLGLEGLAIIGNHGFEQWGESGTEIAPEAARSRPALERLIRRVNKEIQPGMELEDKGATLSIHYRRAEDSDRVRRTFYPRLVEQVRGAGLSLHAGRMVYEIRPPAAINKGTALLRLVDERRLDAVIYLGDDTTDADAMEVVHDHAAKFGLLAVAVGVDGPETPERVREEADFMVQGVPGVETFLGWLSSVFSASTN